MTISWYNVSKEYNNDIIRYHNGTEYKIIVFTSGCYSYSELSNGNFLLKTVIWKQIKIEFDLTSFRCLVTILRLILDLIVILRNLLVLKGK